ncbi:PRTRC system protein E [Bifidobacterium xylocopae]|uniref:PRTRC system protein E n=2 Tax=Bifidobacterium xylocopae TaxID=2493119 RepID=A0A366KG43_9BIFI|nr:PRTRC system protein E [Bifidobacterium xylocopae]
MALSELLMDRDLLLVLLPAVVGSGALSALVTVWAGRRQRRAQAGQADATSEQLAVQAAHEASQILRDDIIAPLREQVEAQERQIRDLQARQAKQVAELRRLRDGQAQYRVAIRYIRRLCHWLDPAVTAMDPGYMARHPKPHLPDELRGQIAPESLGGPPG